MPDEILDDRELRLEMSLKAPRAKIHRGWTEPELLKQWFAPQPLTTPVAELDVRPGGASLIVMRTLDGQEMPNRGVYLEVVANEKLVFANAYTSAWVPSEKPFMTVIVTFEDEGAGTRYVAIPARCTGRAGIATCMRRWASIPAGRNARGGSRRWRRGCRAAPPSPQPSPAPREKVARGAG